MTLKVVVDMNLSPDWVTLLESHRWTAVHWSRVGDPRASDTAIMEWAATHEIVVYALDLDLAQCWHKSLSDLHFQEIAWYICPQYEKRCA